MGVYMVFTSCDVLCWSSPLASICQYSTCTWFKREGLCTAKFTVHTEFTAYCLDWMQMATSCR